jgi:hypothetical protein
MAIAWGDGPYGLDGFGGITNVAVTLTGVQSSVELGTVSLTTVNNFEVTGVEATGLIGDEFSIGSATWGSNVWGGPPGWGGITFASVELQSVSASGELGAVATQTVNYVMTTGVQGVGTLGVVTEVIGGTNVIVSGVLGTTALGEEEIDGDANVTVTGVQAQGFLGTVDVAGQVVVNVTGVVGTIFEGETDESGKAIVTVTGVVGVGRVSRPLVWGLIDTSQNANWMPIAA